MCDQLGRGHSSRPLLHSSIPVLAAPTQAWSSPDGSMRGGAHGVFHGGMRWLSDIALSVDGGEVEHLAVAPGRDRTAFRGLVRAFDGPGSASRVLVERSREAWSRGLVERVTVENGQDLPITVMLELALEVCASPIAAVAAGEHGPHAADVAELPAGAIARLDDRSMVVTARGAEVRVDGSRITVAKRAIVRPGDWASLEVDVEFDDPAVEDRPAALALLAPEPTGRPALDRWTDRAVADLETLLLDVGHGPFPAASAPWDLELVAREALGAARMLLPVDRALAEGVLRTLAAHQGVLVDPTTGEEPGRMPHRLGEAGSYRSLDATPAWIVLLHDAWRAGMPLDAVRDLRPALHAALAWLAERMGEGFLADRDADDHEGWRAEPGAMRHHDGERAAGPFAPAEAQGVAHAAALAAAALLEALGDDGEVWSAWAARLRLRFRDAFWVDDGEERWPAMALDGEGTPVDALSSTIGQLLGTGLLDHGEEQEVARLLLDPRLSSGFGLRSLDADSPAYWPLALHGGAVWPHETAIAIDGCLRAGMVGEARLLAEQLERAAAALDGRLPRVLAGYGADESPMPVPFPAACGTSAWASAGSVVVHRALTASEPAAPREILRRRVVVGADGGRRPVILTGLAPRSPRPLGSDAGERGALRLLDGVARDR